MASCVTTAECDRYVGCPGELVCYQQRCQPQCEGDEECGFGEECAPCRPAGSTGEGRCFGEEGGVCMVSGAQESVEEER